MKEFALKEEEIRRREESLKVYDGEDKIISSMDFAEKLKNVPKDPAIFSKMPTLDSLCGGFRLGQLIIIGGKPKNGKTLLGQTLTSNFFEQGVLSLWFSYEMTPEEFLERFPNLPVLYMPQFLEGKEVDWLSNRIIEAKAKFGIKVVFFDHLHYLIDMGKIQNPSLDIGTVVRNLKRMAVYLKIVVFVMAHVTKLNRGEKATSDDLRDTGMTKGECDKVIMINRLSSENRENQSVITLGADRQTGVMDKDFLVVKRGLLYELETRESIREEGR